MSFEYAQSRDMVIGVSTIFCVAVFILFVLCMFPEAE